MISTKFYYRCSDCGLEYNNQEIRYLCPKCQSQNRANQPPKGVLQVVYNYSEIKKPGISLLNKKLKETEYLSLLPIEHLSSLPQLRVGKTPVYNITKNLKIKGANLYIKDESQNPTYSYKDRASVLVSAFAKEKGVITIAAASTGNAGSSLAGICASQMQKAIVFVPAKAPLAKLTQIVMYGAQLVPVDGTYDDAFNLSIAASNEFGWFNRNTAYNPITIEGKKTAAFEIVEQFSDKLPDYIFVPVGDGVIISGLYKGFEDLLELGIIEKMPILVAVQAQGSNNLIRNLNTDSFVAKPSQTIADSISVDIPRNFYMAVRYIKKYEGLTIEVSDDDIIQASALLSKNTGIFAEPAAAATLAGFLALKKQNKVTENSSCLLLSTGSGLKDLSAVQSLLNFPQPISLNLVDVKNILNL